jgi:hypothetical protein
MGEYTCTMPHLPIEFHLISYIGGRSTENSPAPFPAAQGMPAQLKRIPTEIPVDEDLTLVTVKKCPPFVDAMTGGYLIPIVADVHFTMKPDGLEFTTSMPIVEHHDPRQLAGSALQRMVIVKFLNPWIVKTPPGYSSLFMAPLNRFDLPFRPLAGMVETDTYYHEVNFPAISLLAPGQSVTVKKGTPLIQVIPIRRDNWTSQQVPADMDRYREWDSMGERVGRYKGNNWQRKSYE